MAKPARSPEFVDTRKQRPVGRTTLAPVAIGQWRQINVTVDLSAAELIADQKLDGKVELWFSPDGKQPMRYLTSLKIKGSRSAKGTPTLRIKRPAGFAEGATLELVTNLNKNSNFGITARPDREGR